MRPRHFNCRSVVVPPKQTTWWDIKTVKPCTVHHYGIRKFLASLDSLGYIEDDIAVLVIVDHDDPCKTRIITEDLLTPRERINRESSKRIAAFLAKVLTKHERYASIKEST